MAARLLYGAYLAGILSEAHRILVVGTRRSCMAEEGTEADRARPDATHFRALVIVDASGFATVTQSFRSYNYSWLSSRSRRT